MTGPQRLSRKFMNRVKKLPQGTNAFLRASKGAIGMVLQAGQHGPPAIHWVHEHRGFIHRKVRDTQHGIRIVTRYSPKGIKQAVVVERMRRLIPNESLPVNEARKVLKEMKRRVKKEHLKDRLR